MRIVGGSLSGRKISPPESIVTRPMMDRIRENLFNILSHRDWGTGEGELFSDELYVMDAFCGTGALAFEAVSRGATKAFLFDRDQQAIKVARQNATSLGILGQCSIALADSTSPPVATAQCGLVFLAPPYRKGLIPPAFAALDKAGWISPRAVIVAETAKKEEAPTLPDCETLVSRSYGDTSLHFMKKN